MAMTLDDARNEIDNIDSKMLELFTKRMDVVEKVAEIKTAQGLSVFSPGREKKVLENVHQTIPPKYEHYAISYINYLMELSKLRQREIISLVKDEDCPFLHQISTARKEISSPRVAVQGVKGAYSMSAAMRMYPNARISYLDKWEEVLYSVADASADYGVLPVENSSAGSVNEVFDLLIQYKYFVVKAYSLPVDHCLLGTRGSKLRDIRRVYSHPHAFPQCRGFFNRNHRLEQIPYLNTAMAAEYVSHLGDKENAAIASRDCAKIYGLDIIESSIQENDNNQTRFLSISRKLEIPGDANKISIVFTLPHVTGSLYRTLSRFALCGMNLTKIESRPIPNRNFEYFFYLDFAGNVSSPAVRKLLCNVSRELPNFSFLGNYCES